MSSGDKREQSRRWYLANRERVLAEARARYRLKREAILAQQSEYKAQNRDAIREQKRDHYERNRDALLVASKERYATDATAKRASMLDYRSRPEWEVEQAARRRDWKERNRSRVREYEAERRARRLGLDAERIERAVVWERDGGACRLCGNPADAADWHLEHFIPISLGGPHTYGNVGVAHPACNLDKGVEDPRKDGSRFSFLLN